MRDFMEFFIYTFKACIASMFEIDIGGYSFGAFLTAALVVSIFVSTLVIRFRGSNDVSSISRPPKRTIKFEFNNKKG